MTEREKIIEIIAPFVSAYGEDEVIADALIAAGIGDVRVAERAFKELCIEAIFGIVDERGIKFMWDFYKMRAQKKLAEEGCL